MTRIEYERRRRAWTQTDLAYHARSTQSQISLFERRVLLPSERTLEKLARALGVRPEGLLESVSEVELVAVHEFAATPR